MSTLQKITEEQMDATGVCSAPNVLNGTIAQNKAVFDKMVRQLVAPAYNAAVDAIGEINATETGIQAEEALRVAAESGRVSAESGRVSAETERLSSEALRGSTESSRISAETARSAAESNRVSAENGRAGAEMGRVNAETARAAAEAARASTEVARIGAEAQRAAAESARNVWESYHAAKAYTAGNKVSYLGSSYVCIQAGAGNLPTNAAYWTLIAAKGVDGEGAGDMLAATYDPTGRVQDIFAYADQKASDASQASDPSGSAAAVQANLNAHAGRTDNPHGVTAAQIGAATDSSVRDIIARQKWALLASYLTAGAFTFTVPAGYTKLGVYMIGGGGSGAAMNGSGACSGGASGYGRNITIPVSQGQQISGIVGVGGTAVTRFGGGNPGGTTSFGGNTVSGGDGGKVSTGEDVNNVRVRGADGGQGSDALYNRNFIQGDTDSPRILFAGVKTEDAVYNAQPFIYRGGRSQPPRESQNEFDPFMVTLCAGGFALHCNDRASQIMTPTDTGYKGGNGSSTGGYAVINAEDGVGPGSGGGAKIETYGVNTSSKSGAGAPGAVFIYGVKE